MEHFKQMVLSTIKCAFMMSMLIWITLHLTEIKATRIERDTEQPSSNVTDEDVNGTDGVVNGTDSAVNGTDSAVNGTDSAVNGTDSAVNGTDSAASGTDSAVNGTGSAINGTDSEVNGTDSAVNGTDSAVNGTDSAVNGTDSAVNGTDSAGNGTDSAVNGTDSAVNGTDSAVNGTDSAVNGTDSAVNGTDSAVNGTDSAVNGTDSAVNGTDSAVNGTDSAVNGTDSAVNGTDSAVNGTDSAVNGTDSAVNGSTPIGTDNSIKLDLKRYACVLEVASVSLNDSSDQAWTDELLNKTSEIYSTVKAIAEQQFTEIFPGLNGLEVVQVTDFSEGSIRIAYEVHFNGSGPENSTELQNSLTNQLQTLSCNQSVPCDVGQFRGFNLTSLTVQAVNVCISESLNSCDVNTTTCISNEDGTYACNCVLGYQPVEADVYSCEDIDECEENSHSCDESTTECENTMGAFECVCREGYQKTEEVCSDIDECETDAHNCNTTTSVCSNTVGSYTCTCLPGYLDTNGSCEEPVNPCDLSNCDHICKIRDDNITAECQCYAGYRLMENNRSCEDINECLDGTLCVRQGQYCKNVAGGYQCNCIAGYLLQNGSCVSAPKKFQGTVEVQSLRITDAETFTWKEELGNKSSALFSATAMVFRIQLEVIYSKLQGFVAIRIVSFSQGSIQAEYLAYFDDSGPENSAELQDSLTLQLVSAGCSTNYSEKCDMGQFQGLDLSLMTLTASDPCASTEDNNCDPMTTECKKADDGSYSCHCQSGFKPWPSSRFTCTDLNECEENTHDCNGTTSVCNNTLGSFDCSCLNGYMMRDGKCQAACEPNPCENDGRCEDQVGDYFCRCQGIWTGKNCDEEHSEAVRYRLIAILVGVLMGILCFVLLVGLLMVCCGEKKAQSKNASRSRRGDVGMNDWDYEGSHAAAYQAINASADKPQQVSSFSGNATNGHRLTPGQDNQAYN